MDLLAPSLSRRPALNPDRDGGDRDDVTSAAAAAAASALHAAIT